jgi:hypothetical protein
MRREKWPGNGWWDMGTARDIGSTWDMVGRTRFRPSLDMVLGKDMVIPENHYT